MLEKPDLQDESIIACVQGEYGLRVAHLAFLPVGADVNTAAYRILTEEGTAYFLKLRGGVFDETSVILPKFLGDQGIRHIITSLVTTRGHLWTDLEPFKLIIYPFVEGHDGYETALSDRQWGDLGKALKRIHSLELLPALVQHIRQETYSPKWRESVKAFVGRVEDDTFDDLVAAKVAALLKGNREKILDLVGRAGQLAQALQARSPDFVLCHSDIHAGNILVTAGGAFYIVDWDDPILAPKERDLMYIGGGLMGGWRAPQDEEALFYRGYGQTEIDPAALAHYRYERIVQDIAAYCEQLLLTTEGGEDREQSYRYLASNFLPNGTIEIAYRSDQTRREG